MRRFPVVVLGAGGVGKTALTVRFIQDKFVDNYDPTIEETYQRFTIVDGETNVLEVLDTAGIEQFTNLVDAYIRTGKGFVLVFSLTQEASLDAVNHLRQQIISIKGDSAPIVVVGTKLDLINEREVYRTTIQTLSSQWGLPFYETSAKHDWHVSEAFENLVRRVRLRYPAEKPPTPKKKGPCLIM
ncbi:hypothetical protein GYMLUDRAFT_989785 [Collybiopsis luxurians FD-317 M1]|uniref:Small monomeric GTPase n=1 Tax=Collybiopsis luxurians FD-317 M1 TaxID=944289 RepID=A0A0D0D1W9_9AGAR|nr:hypothetical protein GYMLUDRAFT_989785 [Collybiopsis luxurians FD-317 M1]